MPSLPVDSATSCSTQSAKPTMWVPSATMPSLSRRGLVAGDRARPARAPGLSALSIASSSSDGLGLVEQLGDVDAGEPGRHQAEGGQRRVAAADVRVGVEHAVTGARAAASSGDPGSVTTMMRSTGSMPASRNACS